MSDLDWIKALHSRKRTVRSPTKSVLETALNKYKALIHFFLRPLTWATNVSLNGIKYQGTLYPFFLQEWDNCKGPNKDLGKDPFLDKNAHKVFEWGNLEPLLSAQSSIQFRWSWSCLPMAYMCFEDMRHQSHQQLGTCHHHSLYSWWSYS